MSMTLAIPIVYDHTDFIVINKPCGVAMHDPKYGICQRLTQQMGISQIFLVHRLDTATSGCLLLAKNKSAAATLSQLFAERKIDKYYLAISDKKPKKKQGKIAGDMKKSRDGNHMLSMAQNTPATAITFFQSESIPSGGRLYYVKPVTGKTHQIRVALKSLGSPILGDDRYKGSAADRLYLHSMMLSFTLNTVAYNIRCLPQTGRFFSQQLLDTICSPDSFDWPKYKVPLANTKDLAK
jgi:tRNA pseudouridine32 synthase/23S rRNA pseudouridine746 synthase